MMDIPAYIAYAFRLLMTPNGLASVAAVLGFLWFIRLYRKKVEIVGLTAEIVPDDSWFVHRDDNHRLAAVISLRLHNRGGTEIRLVSVRFSGYAPKEVVSPILLEGKNTSHPLPFPSHDHYYRGIDYRIAPFATQSIWLYFDSGSVELHSKMSAPLVLRDHHGKRTSVRVEITRHPYQVQLYRQQWT